MSIELMKNNCEDHMEMMLMQTEFPITDFAAAADSFQNPHASSSPMREMIFRIAAMQPVHIDPEPVRQPRRRNVRISTDPQSVAARRRRERISERMRILQRLVPGGTKMDTASMLDEAVHYVKFLKNQVRSLEGMGFAAPVAGGSCFPAAGPANVRLLADRHM